MIILCVLCTTLPINFHPNSHIVVAGCVTAEKPCPHVDKDLLTDIMKWKNDGLEWSDMLSRLRPRTVPPGYTPSPWKKGRMYCAYNHRVNRFFFKSRYEVGGGNRSGHVEINTSTNGLQLCCAAV